MINERISKLRKMMAKRNIDAYIVPSSDPHQSEYLADYYKTREFITGFTGSAGTAVITTKKSGLWTDGRYFIQAAKELAAGEVELYKTGLPESISIEEFLLQEFPNRGKIAFDGNNTSVAEYENLIKKLPNFELMLTMLEKFGMKKVVQQVQIVKYISLMKNMLESQLLID